MAVLIVPYKDINQVLKGIRLQVIESWEYCKTEMPSFNDPETLFNVLRNIITYKNDKNGIEQLQTVQTLFDNNIHGISGAGDCDCFTILVLSMCWANNLGPQKIVLAGKSKKAPTHIWSKVKHNGKWYNLDLTQPLFDTTREYKLTQEIEV
tara:strand:+ start:296 stop:748 length:453 start_codon:yes stop_codon:yes gene_type:complete